MKAKWNPSGRGSSRRTKSEKCALPSFLSRCSGMTQILQLALSAIRWTLPIRKRVQEALLTSRNQLAALAVRLESVREEERTRIALEVP